MVYGQLRAIAESQLRESLQYADGAVHLAAGISIVHTNLCLIYLKVGRLEPARSEARLAARYLSLSPKPLNDLAQVYMWLAIVERLLGNPQESLTAAERSVEAARRAAGASESLTVAARIEFAYAQALAGDFRRAIPELNRCLTQARAGSSEEDLFHALHSLGYAPTLAGRAHEGEEPLREAMEAAPAFWRRTALRWGYGVLSSANVSNARVAARTRAASTRSPTTTCGVTTVPSM